MNEPVLARSRRTITPPPHIHTKVFRGFELQVENARGSTTGSILVPSSTRISIPVLGLEMFDGCSVEQAFAGKALSPGFTATTRASYNLEAGVNILAFKQEFRVRNNLVFKALQREVIRLSGKLEELSMQIGRMIEEGVKHTENVASNL